MCESHRHAVVTGTSTGIGRATALRLAANGYHVFATVRTEADGRELSTAGDSRITPIVMDVTDAGQVADAAATVRQAAGAGLDLLVNNAGQAHFLPLELLPPETFRHHLAVNTEGPLLVTQALLPALRASAGRIIFIGSISSWFTMPFCGSHAATKHALAAVAKALRVELAPWDIRVSMVDPGSVRTAAIDKMKEEHDLVMREMTATERALYGETLSRMIAKIVEESRKGSDPDDVARVVLRAATVARPRLRYLVGRSARMPALLAKMPVGVVDTTRRRIFGLPRPGSFRS
jgi:NAD(P)-dependent dehydrogenase (short-subunit alcohol dehydrogenase family)